MPISSVLGASALLPGGLGFRNKLINGDFRINQRSLSSTGTVNGVAPVNAGYGYDRWSHFYNGGTATFSAQTFSVGNAIAGQEPINYLRIATSGQSGANYAHLAQKIEDVRSCAGQQIAISFWARADAARNVAIELQQNFGSGGSPTSTVLKYVGTATLSTSWTRYSFVYNVPSISGMALGTNNDHYLLFAVFVSAGTGFESRTNSLGIQNGTFEFWGFQLEQNYQVTPFEQRPYTTELALCQRYFFVYPQDYMSDVLLCFTADQAGWGRGVIQCPVEMRAAPTLARTPTVSKWRILGRAGSTPETIDSISIDTASKSHILLNVYKTMSTNQVFTLRPAGNGANFEQLWFGAEL